MITISVLQNIELFAVPLFQKLNRIGVGHLFVVAVCKVVQSLEESLVNKAVEEAETLARKGKKKMICEKCGCEITGNWLKYKGKCFCRKDNDSCFKDWLYDQTDGECEYGTMLDGEEVQLAPSWTEEYLNTLGLSKKDF